VRDGVVWSVGTLARRLGVFGGVRYMYACTMDINWVDAYCYCHCMPRVTPAFSERERERDEIQTRQTLSCIIPVIPHFKVQWELPYVESHVVIDGCHLTILICC
jgi:hypothetical protein